MHICEGTHSNMYDYSRIAAGSDEFAALLKARPTFGAGIALALHWKYFIKYDCGYCASPASCLLVDFGHVASLCSTARAVVRIKNFQAS
jgi:hypothetical protein